jgi:hypothetical protein
MVTSSDVARDGHQDHRLGLRKIAFSDVVMSRTELIIQLVKVVIGLAFGAYFLWWSLEVLSRLPPP